jgi:2,3-bisphosphoglycerate-dependent phosphoglycerate mutase
LAGVPTLVLLRHGESVWNAANLFTGWTDVDLSPLGEAEAHTAGRQLADEHDAGRLDLQAVHTSVLTRAVRTASLATEALGRPWLPVRRHWRLNERHYGALQGLDKRATAEQYGDDQVRAWRRSYDVPPPTLDPSDERHPAHDRRYRMLPADALPATECLADVVRRVVPYWEDALAADLRSLGDVLVVAHGNSIRALVKHLRSIPDDAIVDLEVPTGVPWCLQLDDRLAVRDARFLGDPDDIRARQQAVRQQSERPR